MSSYQARLFSFLWAVAVIFSFNSSYGWFLNVRDFSVFHVALIMAICLLFRPESRTLLRLSIISFLVVAFTIMPGIQNHRMVLAFAGVALLFSSSGDDRLPRALADLRWLTIIVYFFAALAKFNTDYLRDEVSCATIFLKQAIDLNGFAGIHIPSVGDGVSLSGLWSLLAEVALIVLLTVPRTRVVGVLFGFSFHFFLATDYIKYFTNFSCVMFLVLSSWLTEKQSEYIVIRFFERYRKGLIGGVAFLITSLMLVRMGFLNGFFWIFLRYLVWLSFAIPLCVVIWNLVRRPLIVSSNSRLPSPHLSILFLAILNGASPYLGLKTLSTFSMYSNLRVEPDYTNHLFMPTSRNLVPFLSDTIKITASSDPDFKKLVTSSTERLPYLTLCSYLNEMDDRPRRESFEVTFERRGILTTAVRGEALPSDCPSWIARKFLRYATVGDGAEKQCVW